MTSKGEIIELLQSNRDAIKKYGVNEIGIFGSFARNDQREGSDVDVLVEMERETFDDYMGLLLFLEELFGRNVDLVMKDTIKPLIRDRILREAIYVAGF